MRAILLADLMNTASRLPLAVAMTRAERIDALLAFLLEPVAERAVLAAPACWITTVVATGTAAPPPAGADTCALTMTVMLGSGSGELVPGASGSVGLGPVPA